MGAGRQAVGIVEKLKAQVEQQTEVIEELKQRLEEAADSEELVLNLGERNSKLGERVKELESLAEHWQSMYEVSEEMYEGHSDEVRQLNSEINRLEWEIKQREQDIKRLNELSEEHVEIIGRFKEAVVQFQDERKQAEKREQELQTQVESSGGATRKLGELADKAGKAMQTVRARSMELELQKNEMELCLQEIKILSSYLPESIVKNEIISVGGFLGIRRLEMLSRLICKQLEQHQQDQENYKQLSSEQVDKEYLNIAICRRVFACSAEVAELIVHNIETSSEQEFLAVGNVLNSNQQEIQSIELKVRELVRDGTLQDIGDGQGISRLNHAISVGKSLQELLVRCEKRLMAVDGENKKGSTKENSMQSVKKAVTELGYSIDQIQVGLLYFFDNFIENEELVHKSESVLGGLKGIKLLLVKLQCKVVDELFRRSNDNRKATDEIEEYRVDVDTRQLDDIVASISLLLRFSEVLVKLIDQTKSEFGDNKDNAMDTEPSAESSGYTLQLFEALFKQAADSVLLDSSSADSSVEPLSSSLQLPSNVDLCYFDEKISQVYNILGPIVTSLIEQYNNSDFTTDSNITNQLTSHTHDSERATIKVCKVVTPWKSKNLQETNNVQDLEKSALTIRSLNQQVLNLATQIKQAHHANEEYKVQIQVLQKRKRTTDSQYQETITQLKNDLETSNKLKAQFENIVEGLHAEIDSLNANKPVANIGTTSSVDMALASPATVPNSVAGVNADSNLEPNYKTLGAYNATTNIQVNNNYIYTQSNVVDDSILAMQLKACRKNIQSLNLQVAKLKLAKLDPLSNPNRIAGDFDTGAGTFSNTLALAPSTLAASSRLSPALIKLPKLIDISSHKKIKLSS
ncbi:Dynactin subunit 1 [Zancudomyces culisetae]|uniref:Dynactin subunit 1 n=1 Tax=Zancudomyces culisetae TaxID=1213189 RepID=A0A1R1PP12_ZANCU|nr:Dynactin subunit 1 [Zancudomyces culisetae]|eukprot:OMH82707.1 Dynactin subunit 1 [Zancudomyces culisetae]